MKTAFLPNESASPTSSADGAPARSPVANASRNKVNTVSFAIGCFICVVVIDIFFCSKFRAHSEHGVFALHSVRMNQGNLSQIKPVFLLTVQQIRLSF